MSKETQWSHDALALDLASHLRANGERMVWTDMQLGSSGSPRPDVYSIAKTYARFNPLAYEVKISVADFRRDVTAGKWQSYLKFASGVIFAVPAGLIDKKDVPPGCGLMIRSENVWRAVKGPTLKATETLPRDAWMKLLIDGLNRLVPRDPKPRDGNQWRVKQEILKEYGAGIAEALADRDRAVSYFNADKLRIDAQLVDLRERAKKKQQEAKDAAEKEAGPINYAKAELARALGLPDDAALWTIQQAVRDTVTRLNEATELKRMRNKMEQVQNSITHALRQVDYALEPLPSLNNVEPQPSTRPDLDPIDEFVML